MLLPIQPPSNGESCYFDQQTTALNWAERLVFTQFKFLPPKGRKSKERTRSSQVVVPQEEEVKDKVAFSGPDEVARGCAPQNPSWSRSSRVDLGMRKSSSGTSHDEDKMLAHMFHTSSWIPFLESPKQSSLGYKCPLAFDHTLTIVL
jgi:hypothetical protein